MLKQTLVVSMVALFAAAPAFAQDGGQNADQVAKAKADIEKYASPATTWDGPTTGPKIETGKTIVVLAGDLKNGGILGVTNGVEEAAKAASWTVKVLDGAGSVQGRAAAFGCGAFAILRAGRGSGVGGGGGDRGALDGLAGLCAGF